MSIKVLVEPNMPNHYENLAEKSLRANDTTDTTESEDPSKKWLSILVGLIAGGLLAPVVALGLAFIVLLPPMSGFFGLGGEFDGLWLMGIPIFALPCGIIGGLVFGGTWKWRRGYTIALLCASLPAAAHFFSNAWGKEMTKNPRDVFTSTFVISLCMVLSAAISLKLIATLLAAIERYRSNRLNRT